MKQIIAFLKQINIYKTLYVNFKAFGLRNALNFPILCFNKVSICGLNKGGVKCPIKFASIKIGAIQLGFSECRHPVTKISFGGKVVFEGRASIGSGSYVDCAMNATLRFGNNFRATGFTTILASKEIRFGKDCLVSWDTLIMDSDAHSVYSMNAPTLLINPPKSIIIGDKVWIGARTTVLKGVIIGDNAIVASNSCITKDVMESMIVASNSQKEIKNNVIWDERNPN